MLLDMYCYNCNSMNVDKYFRNRDAVSHYRCDRCGYPCSPRITRVNVNMDSTCAGWDPVLETELRGNSHRKLVMKAKGLRERDVNARGEKRRWV